MTPATTELIGMTNCSCGMWSLLLILLTHIQTFLSQCSLILNVDVIDPTRRAHCQIWFCCDWLVSSIAMFIQVIRLHAHRKLETHPGCPNGVPVWTPWNWFLWKSVTVNMEVDVGLDQHVQRRFGLIASSDLWRHQQMFIFLERGISWKHRSLWAAPHWSWEKGEFMGVEACGAPPQTCRQRLLSIGTRIHDTVKLPLSACLMFSLFYLLTFTISWQTMQR